MNDDPFEMTRGPGAGPLTEAQRQRLSELLRRAVIEIRLLGSRGNAEQAADLADAIYNIPTGMWSENFSLPHLRDCFLAAYQAKYSDRSPNFNYVAWTDEIIAMAR